ncbi:PAS domain S-box-containing protein/diguanylate cyclase (GGDEF) domain-containing protein [Desulfomicrobium norvegicum]|uniref:PAS domain S-box-containing protein/diguanylate cyclase (GGDEF) domain-containing protein n=1 Tax=Desulfomicrobium norvegicum (strain DSM 1741 / NCIMB 8310) TaxID=52561 RepID=A0A8G2C5Q2_DESNO|nr:diguanylate cyclase [Desulfomicrobium norvegicum]SFM14500.1 PAS domain S-box-containing protein/diguanylate cyclase (GGDEF) domain-containing protein [Desulfomicrobium norvegicum]
MYQRLLNIFMATRNPQLETLLRGVPPQEGFSHQFIGRPDIAEADIKGCAVIILDFDAVAPECVAKIHDAKDEYAIMIGCFDAGSFPVLAEWHHLFDQVWIRPFSEDRVQASFLGILGRLKEREDALLNRKYLDTLIDSLPELIWFKDARGAHLKVNSSFCRTVNKTKEQIEGRGHYYIWDIEPDEYAQGEYICLESEEIVLNKKETCLFDETVKCGGELRKFKTYKSPIFDTDGEVIGTTGFAHDVTDLQNLMIELNILIESLPFAIMVTDKENKVTIVNQKFIDIFVLDRSELIGKSVDSFLNETGNYTRSKRWIIEHDEDDTLLISKSRILKVHDENLLDIFGVLAGHIYLFVDITLEYHHRNKLVSDANTDYLTKLNNRRSLQDFMRKTPPLPDTALLLADLDNFKEVNDQYGHEEGDRVLVAFADMLLQIFPAENLFRLGGDEFAILLHNVGDSNMPRQCAGQILAGFAEKVACKFPHTNISVSIGIAMDNDKDENFGELFKKADMALYESKKAGKNVYKFWNR